MCILVTLCFICGEVPTDYPIFNFNYYYCDCKKEIKRYTGSCTYHLDPANPSTRNPNRYTYADCSFRRNTPYGKDYIQGMHTPEGRYVPTAEELCKQRARLEHI